MKLTLIAAVDETGLLCDEEGFVWHLPRDVAFFRQYTLTHPHLFVGRTTYEQMHGWFKPEHRLIVLSREIGWQPPATLGVRAENVIDAIHTSQTYDAQEWVCIGGAQIYEAFLPYASDLLLTRVKHRFTPRGRGTYFPEFANLEHHWSRLSQSDHSVDKDHPYALSFCHYQKR